MDKRRSVRRIDEVLVRFEGDNFSIYSRARNVSNRGAFLATHYLLDPGTPIRVFLPDTEGEETSVKATVVRTVSEASDRGEVSVGLGVEFLEEAAVA